MDNPVAGLRSCGPCDMGDLVMPVIGFTGTQHGMTSAQKDRFREMVSGTWDEFHHGDCIGADAEAHDILKNQRPLTLVAIHPPINPSKRANKEGDFVYPPKPYLERNHDIVDVIDKLIATPYEFKEQLRSGTWATIRYATKKHKRVVVIYPDGSIVVP